jgi:hypothetical protein
MSVEFIVTDDDDIEIVEQDQEEHIFTEEESLALKRAVFGDKAVNGSIARNKQHSYMHGSDY